MPTRIIIALKGNAPPAAPNSALVHRFRNFGEDLYREFSRSGQADISLDEVDAATSEFTVVVKAKRHIGTVSAFIKKTLARHNLDDHYTISHGR